MNTRQPDSQTGDLTAAEQKSGSETPPVQVLFSVISALSALSVDSAVLVVQELKRPQTLNSYESNRTR